MITPRIFLLRKGQLFTILFALSIAGCMTPRKMDKFIASQYGNRVPSVSKGNNDAIKVSSAVPQTGDQISSTVRTSKVLPLIVYWHFDYKTTSTLNPAIPINKLTNTILSLGRRKLSPRLNGRQLELSIDQLPHAFTLDDDEHAVWVIYLFHWCRLSMLPSGNDMVVSYKLLDGNTTLKTGKVTVKDTERPMPIGMFQSWKNATSTYIARYNTAINRMSQSVIDQLTEQL